MNYFARLAVKPCPDIKRESVPPGLKPSEESRIFRGLKTPAPSGNIDLQQSIRTASPGQEHYGKTPSQGFTLGYFHIAPPGLKPVPFKAWIYRDFVAWIDFEKQRNG